LTGDEITRQSRPTDAGGSRTKALLLVIASTVLVAAGATWYLGFRPGADSQAESADAGSDRPHFQQWTTYICLGCAVELDVTKTTQREGDQERVEESLTKTALSDRLGGEALVSKCTHDWYLLSGSFHKRRMGGSESAPNHSAFRRFCETAAGAEALVEFAEATGRNSERVWRTLGLWLTHLHPFEFIFSEPRREDPESKTRLRDWLDRRFSAIERTQQGRGRGPGHSKISNDTYQSKKYD